MREQVTGGPTREDATAGRGVAGSDHCAPATGAPPPKTMTAQTGASNGAREGTGAHLLRRPL